MRRLRSETLPIMAFSSLFLAGPSLADDLVVGLSGYQEVPPVSTEGVGQFRLLERFRYELAYDLEPGNEIVSAQVRFGQKGVEGDTMVWLCANPDFDFDPAPPADTPACEGRSDVIEGRVTPEDIVGPVDQGIGPADVRGARRAFAAGATYVNVHTTDWPAGELRGQLLFGADGDVLGRLDALEEEVDDLRHDLRNHTHTYLTGRGAGHNNTPATTGPAEF